jgi:uncharacterized cofD-like protein
MRVKRWLILVIVGVFLISLGVSLIVSTPYFRSIYVLWRNFVFGFFNRYWLAVVFGLAWLMGGVALAVYGLQKMNRSVITAISSLPEKEVVNEVFKKRQLEKGPSVVAIGGGHGLYSLLHGLKNYTSNITAVVTVFDDGGSSGRLREEMGVLPPGDIRNCLIALADAEPLMGELFQYRFGENTGLEGHNFGNLLITALAQITGDFQKAVFESSKILAVRGKVLPTTTQNVFLRAECEDGSIVLGESQVGTCGKKIKRIFLEPQVVHTTPEVIKAIEDADLIVLGPGSLYTSVLCNLAVGEVREAILRSSAPLVFVCNITTQPGETDGYDFSDHLQAVFQFIPPQRLNYVLINNGKPNSEGEEELSLSGAEMVQGNGEEVPSSVKIIKADLISYRHPSRHDSQKLAQAIMSILLEEKPSWTFYLTLHNDEILKNLNPMHLMGQWRTKSWGNGENKGRKEKTLPLFKT